MVSFVNSSSSSSFMTPSPRQAPTREQIKAAETAFQNFYNVYIGSLKGILDQYQLIKINRSSKESFRAIVYTKIENIKAYLAVFKNMPFFKEENHKFKITLIEAIAQSLEDVYYRKNISALSKLVEASVKPAIEMDDGKDPA